MPIAVTPYIPTYITVHLGTPDSNTENVTVSFRDYIKNVASSEIYPTWELSALRANILAQVSFALNRIYTEFYPSRGYNFNITGTTAYDQRFIKNRTIFENISELVDELFNTYIRRQGFVEPLAAQFCNGTTSFCEGLSQWGSQGLAQDGYNSIDILRYYYGNNIELVSNAPIQDIQYSYPGEPMRRGDVGPYVRIAQVMLNRIGQNYPAIPKLEHVDGIFGAATEDSVRVFQGIFNLTVDGIIGRSTWYMMVQLHSSILRLSELASLGQTHYVIDFTYQNPTIYGESGSEVSLLQYILSVLSQFYVTIPFLTIDGVFGDETLRAVKAFQREVGLPQSGEVNESTWLALVNNYLGIDTAVLSDPTLFPETAESSLRTYEYLQNALASLQHTNFLPLIYGQTDAERSAAL